MAQDIVERVEQMLARPFYVTGDNDAVAELVAEFKAAQDRIESLEAQVSREQGELRVLRGEVEDLRDQLAIEERRYADNL